MADPKKKIENPLFATTEVNSNGPGGEDNESRRRLLVTAGKLFAEKGFDGVSTRDIAAAAGVNISLISYYFNGKEGLYVAVLQDTCVDAQSKYDELFANYNPEQLTREVFVKMMTHVIRELVAMKTKNPYMPQLLHRELIEGFPRAKPFVDEMAGTVLTSLIELLRTAQKKKIVKPDLHLPTYFMTMIHAIDTYHLFINSKTKSADMCLQIPSQKDEYIRQNVIMFIEGVLT